MVFWNSDTEYQTGLKETTWIPKTDTDVKYWHWPTTSVVSHLLNSCSAPDWPLHQSQVQCPINYPSSLQVDIVITTKTSGVVLKYVFGQADGAMNPTLPSPNLCHKWRHVKQSVSNKNWTQKQMQRPVRVRQMQLGLSLNSWQWSLCSCKIQSKKWRN